MMVPMDDSLQNKYSMVKGVARRARQLQSGATPLIHTNSLKACRVAQDEILGGQVRFVVPVIPRRIEPLPV